MINNLPDNWAAAKLGDVCKTTSGGTPSRKREDYFQGDIPWVKSGELPDGPIVEIEEYITEEAVKNSSAKLFPSGSLLVALYGATVGKLGILNRDATTNQAVCAIFPTESLDAKYLFWYLRYVRSDLIAQAIGGAQPNISQGILRELELPIAPLEQQKRIVAEIEKQFSRLDEAVANLKRVKANLKRYKAAVLKAAVEGKLTEEWRKRHPDVEPASKLLERILTERRQKWEETELANMKFKGKAPKNNKSKEKYKEPKGPTTDLTNLPAGWVWANLELLKEFSLYGPRFSSTDYSEKGIHVLRTSDINESGKVNTKTTPKLDLDDIQYEKYKVNKGDLLITRTGSLGTLAVYNDDVRAIPGAYLIQYRLAAGHHTSWFLFYFFKSPLGLKQIIKGGAGVGRPNLNAPTIEDIKTPFPPSAEQKEIIRKIESAFTLTEKLETQIEDNLVRADRLRQSILMNAFSGRFVS